MLNIAVAGCGYWGPNLIRNFNSLSECRLKSVCDTDAERLAHMKTLYPPVETTSQFDDLVNDREIDAIAVATPVRFHYEMARKALLAGKHTLIEKPMARSSKECEELVELAERNKLALMVGHTFIYSRPVRKIKEIVSAGELGDLQYISARRLNLGLLQKDINVAWDLAPHDISIILYVLGKDPVSVNCQGKSHVAKGVEDVTNMTLNFSNGAFGIVQSSWLDPNKVRETVFIGTKKMLVYDDVEPIEKIRIYDKRVEIPPHYDSFGEFQYSYHYGGMYSPYLKLVEPLKVECQHFLDCIKSGTHASRAGHSLNPVVRKAWRSFGFWRLLRHLSETAAAR
ncbi:MAG: Gfo/Idh/MocA family protein [Planctomycetota bacterium]